MIHTVNLPDIGEGVAEGEVIKWLKNVGEMILQDEPVVVVMTDKATVELPSPYPGKLMKQYYKPGEIATLGLPLYDIEKEGVTSILATPHTRALAKELGVQIEQIQGSGKDGRITDQDVVHFHAKVPLKKTAIKRAHPPIQECTPPLHMPDDIEEPMLGMRHLIAEKMVESKYIVPHFSFFDRLDATRLIQLKEKIQEEAKKEGVTLTYMPLIIRALSLTIKKFPQCNASVDLTTHQLIIHRHQNMGIATKTDQGLLVAVLKGVDEMTLPEIIRAYELLMKKAKKGELAREELIDSTITISNFGPLGGRWATPIINYPEVAILGLAKIAKEAVVRNDEIVIRSLMNLSWSFDHRVIDGEQAAGISNYLIALLENPAQLLC